MAIKDQIDVAGYPTSAGNGALKPYAHRKRRDRRHHHTQGAVVFAKTISRTWWAPAGSPRRPATTDNRWFGTAHNPYDLMRTRRRIEGGNGALLGARVVPAAIGEDTGGSIRCPSAFCGTAGLRPSTFTVENMTATAPIASAIPTPASCRRRDCSRPSAPWRAPWPMWRSSTPSSPARRRECEAAGVLRRSEPSPVAPRTLAPKLIAGL